MKMRLGILGAALFIGCNLSDVPEPNREGDKPSSVKSQAADTAKASCHQNTKCAHGLGTGSTQ